MSQRIYNFSREAYQAANTLYYDGADEQGNQVLIEVARNPFPTREDLVGLKNDFDITSNLAIGGVLSSRELIKHQSGIAIVKEYFDGRTLSELAQQQALSVEKFLGIAIKITGIIQELHARHVVHRNINADNIFVSKDGKKVKLSNFNIATQFVRGQHEVRLGSSSMGALTHMSPEQTGRMNRSVDYRTDLYSLGVTFYQLLCGRLPFENTDAMELVHAHIARSPVPPSIRHPAVSHALSDIVMKLLAKNSEDRYQSAAGLKWDLEECLRQLKENGSIGVLKIAANDHSPVLCISEKLYGRERETVQLMEAFERCRDKAIEMVLVAGYSGAGKTRLINEIHKPIAARAGYFCSGKYDQFNRDAPYSAVAQAFGSLIRQLLGERNEDIAAWKEKILEALQGNGQVLTDIIPELEMLIGKQPQLLKLGAAETKTRFFNVFENFLAALGSEAHPLVIFVDDLQWADSGSLDLLHDMLTGLRAKSVLLIGAYRDNEVSPAHPLMTMLSRVREISDDKDKVRTITLKELSAAEVNNLVADTLRQSAKDTAALSTLIYDKTKGNPFFVRQFIQRLSDDELIYFDLSLSWQWDADGIARMNVTDNVVDLLVSKLRKLSPEAQQVLMLASCIGNRFDLQTLSIVSEKSEHETASALWEAMREEFITPLGHWSRHDKDELWSELGIAESPAQRAECKFQHDKIQQAAYSLIPEEAQKPTSLKIGRLLLQNLSEEEMSERLFDVLALLNSAAELLINDAEKERIAALNLKAGERAKNANAPQVALNSLKVGMTLLEHKKTSDVYKALLLLRSQCEYLCGNFEESERIYDIALESAVGNFEKASICSGKMLLYEDRARHAEAIAVAQQGLLLLGMELPAQPEGAQVAQELAEVKKLLGNKTNEELQSSKAVPSQEIVLTQKLLNNLFSPAYLTGNRNLLTLFTCRMVKLSVLHGNSPVSAAAYAIYGYVCSLLGDY